MTTEETEFRRNVGFTRTLPKNVVTAIFACPSCNWPLVGAKFTELGKGDDLHESVFELMCEHCKWHGGVLGRDIVDCMIDDWTSHKVRDYHGE
jgi:hypothetical protein